MLLEDRRERLLRLFMAPSIAPGLFRGVGVRDALLVLLDSVDGDGAGTGSWSWRGGIAASTSSSSLPTRVSELDDAPLPSMLVAGTPLTGLAVDGVLSVKQLVEEVWEEAAKVGELRWESGDEGKLPSAASTTATGVSLDSRPVWTGPGRERREGECSDAISELVERVW